MGSGTMVDLELDDPPDLWTPTEGEAAIRFALLVMLLLGAAAAPFFWLASRTLDEELGSR